MLNIILGVSTLLVCGVIYLAAWRKFFTKKYLHVALLICLAGLLLRVFVSLDFYLHPWDERYHALVAKNMIENPLKSVLYADPVLPFDTNNWTANHVWLHKQPLPLWLMALSMYLFGVSEIALRLPSVLMSTLAIFLLFDIGKRLFHPRVGLVAAFLFSIHGLTIELAGGRIATDHIDIAFLFFILAGIVFAVRTATSGKIYLAIPAGLAMGAAILCKWLPALIVLVVAVVLFGVNRKSMKQAVLPGLMIFGSAVFVALPWQIYIHTAFPQEALFEQQYNIKHITEVVEGHSHSGFYYLNKLRIQLGEPVFIALIWFFFITFRRWRISRSKLSILLWFAVPYLFFSIVQTKLKGYVLFAYPAVLLMYAFFMEILYRTRYRWKHPRLVNIFLLFCLALPVRYGIERLKALDIRERSPAWVDELKSLRPETDLPLVVFNVERPIEAMFYGDCIAYQNLPDDQTLKRLMSAGYEIRVLE